eukprot:c11141_g1_i2.p1 GENE.c11141_g1_i2~~c11141_g1_i2.p1  ORF type:complete len:545 (+),score=144.44 c11141_g1_i2:88-1722(+)
MSACILHSGFLKKRPPARMISTFKASKIRYFILGTDGVLRYYCDTSSKEVKGEIDLGIVLGLEQRESGFIIHTSCRDWVLMSIAEDQQKRMEDVDTWIKRITDLLSPLPSSASSRTTRQITAEEAAKSSLSTNTDVESLAADDPHAAAARSSARSSSTYSDNVLGEQIKTFVRKKVSQKKYRFTKDGFDLDLCYITKRIIAMGFPSQGMEGMYRNPLEQVQRFFKTYHNGHYRLYNLCSERSYEHSLFDGRVHCFPFDDHNPPKMSLISHFCEDLDEFLNEHPDNVAAIHCKAGKGRTGTMICCYLLHSRAEPTADSAMHFYGVMRTSDGHGVTIPSQRRYVQYYETELNHGVQPPKVIRIQAVRFETVPSFDIGGGCDPYFKVFIENTKVYDYRTHVPSIKPARKKSGDHFMDVSEHGLVIAGDCKFLFFDADTIGGSDKMFAFWINTGYLDGSVLRLTKSELDGAANDKKGRFDDNFVIEVTFEILGRGDHSASFASGGGDSSGSDSYGFEENDDFDNNPDISDQSLDKTYDRTLGTILESE